MVAVHTCIQGSALKIPPIAEDTTIDSRSPIIVKNVSYVDEVISTELTGTSTIANSATAAIVGCGHPR